MSEALFDREMRSLDYRGTSDTAGGAQRRDCAYPRTFNGTVVRCRKCAPCRALHRWKLRKKMAFEAAHAARTWFVTLTLADPSVGYRAVQLWLKLIRKSASAAGTRVRFFCAEEFGELNGRKHWHVLLFLNKALPRRKLAEKTWIDGTSVRSRRLWEHGFQSWALLRTSNAATYISKSLGYVAKGGRYRASTSLGSSRMVQSPLVAAVFASFPGATVLSVGGRTPWNGKVPPETIGPQRAEELSRLHREAETCWEAGRKPQHYRLIKPIAVSPRRLPMRSASGD